MRLQPSRRLIEIFQLEGKEVVTLVGAGGKTTLMYELARELVEGGKRVITTTTTMIWLPSNGATECLIIDAEGKIPKDVFSKYRHVTCATRMTESGKLDGVEPEMIGHWSSTLDFDCIILEGDGSKGRPLKGPANYEPVIPPHTTLYVPIVGVDALGKKLDEENVHRPQIVSELAKVELGCKVTPKIVGAVMRYYLSKAISIPRSIVYINKVSTEHEIELAKLIAQELEGTEVAFGSVREKRYWLVRR